MRLCLTIFYLSFALYGFGEVPTNYYASAAALSGAPLRDALHQIIRGHRVVAYASSAADTSDALKVLDEDPQNSSNVWLLYAQRSEPKATFALSTGWNREHQWPNSYGLDDVQPAYSDLHNLRAEDANVNSARGNKSYDESNTADSGYRSPAHAEAPLCSADLDSWEPPDVVKGDIARSLFYMTVRYTGDAANEPRLILTDDVGQIGSATNLMGRLSTLLQWHKQDPVSAAERLRNDRIYSLYQGNRNPFVDHPEWVDLTLAPADTNAPKLLVISAVPFTVAWLATNQSPFVLEMQTAPGVQWVMLTNSATLTNGQWRATIRNTGGSALFRLAPRS